MAGTRTSRPPLTCACDAFPPPFTCAALPTQEDLLCDTCRDTAPRPFFHWQPIVLFHPDGPHYGPDRVRPNTTTAPPGHRTLSARDGRDFREARAAYDFALQCEQAAPGYRASDSLRLVLAPLSDAAPTAPSP